MDPALTPFPLMSPREFAELMANASVEVLASLERETTGGIPGNGCPLTPRDLLVASRTLEIVTRAIAWKCCRPSSRFEHGQN